MRRLRRLLEYGPVVVVQLAAHRAKQALAERRFGRVLRDGPHEGRFLPAGFPRLALVFDGETSGLSRPLEHIEDLIYGGAFPLSSHEWLDANSGAVFCPVRFGVAAPVSGTLAVSPMIGLEDALACHPFSHDRKIPQDLARLSVLWLLVAADALCGRAKSPYERQARFRQYVGRFFDRASSRRHVFWSCPMDAGIGATNLLFTSEYFIELHRESDEAARIRGLRDRWCASAVAFITACDEWTPVLNNNHHLLNLVSRTILTGLGDAPGAFACAADRLTAEFANHFDSDGFLAEGSTWYHEFVRHALTFAADILAAVHPGDLRVAKLGELVRRIRDARAVFSAGDALLLIGDADGAVYGPNVAVAEENGPGAQRRVALVKRYPAPVPPGVPYAQRDGETVVIRGRAARVALAALGEAAAEWSTTLRRRRSLTLRTTRVRPRGATTASLRVAQHSEFGALVVTSGSIKVVVRTLPKTEGRPMGHFHLDLGAVFVAVDGEWLAADPGVLTYTGDMASRERLRRSQAHPTLIPDDRQAVRPTGPFSATDARVVEQVVQGADTVTVTHVSEGDAYHVLVRALRSGGVLVRQWTQASHCNLPSTTATGTSYGYLI